MLIMNDNDFEEKQLLNALDGNQIEYRQQHYNFDYQLNNNNNHRSDYRGHGRNHYQEQHFDIEPNQCQYDRSEPVQSIEPYDFDPNSSSSSHVSTGSMAAEEFLEEFLDDNNKNNNDQQPNTMSTNDNVDDRYPTKPDKKLMRKITFCNISNNNKRNLNHKVSKPNDASATSKPTHRRSKSAASTESCSNGDDADTPFRVDEPTTADILCGQSRVCANHPGNRFFQSVLDEYAYRYDLASSKQAKMCMTKEIVAQVHENLGHFLKQKKDGMWEEISTVAARDKVSHALRTKVASWKRTQQQQNQKQQQSQRRGSVTPPRGTRRRMSHSSIQSPRRRSSNPETTSSPSSTDIAPIPFDGHEASDAILSGLMKSQKDYFATMNTLLSSNSSHNRGSSNHPNRGHSFPTYPSNHHHGMQR